MYTPRSTASFITALLMTCGFTIGGLASPAAAHRAAHRIVVTTLTDTADPPFNADDPCGTGQQFPVRIGTL
jgi:hypothetical protein